MHYIPIKTPIVTTDTNLHDFLKSQIENKLQEGDILLISSKIVAFTQKRLVDLSDIKVSEEAQKYADISKSSAEFCQLVLDESDQILGAVPGAMLTIKDGVTIANAGIDQSNVPENNAVLWPKDPEEKATELLQFLKNLMGIKKLGIIMTDSHCLPLRSGSTAFALAADGFEGVVDERGEKDLFGREMQITQRNVADMIAGAADMLMGDTNESIPLVIVRDASVNFVDRFDQSLLKMEKEKCLFESLYG